MKILSAHKESYVSRVIKALFSEKTIQLDETLAGQVSRRIYLPFVTETCFFMSLVFLFYEGFFEKNITFYNGLVPSFLIVLGVLFSKKERIKICKSDLWFFAFLLILLLSASFSVVMGVPSRLLILGWLVYLQFFMAIFLAKAVKNKILALKTIVFLSLPLALIGLYQFLFKVKTSALWLSPNETGINTRAFAFFGSPNVLGILLAIVLIVAISLYLKERQKVYLVIFCLDLAALIVTFSRTSWLGLAVGTLFFILAYKPRAILLVPVTFIGFLIPQFRERVMIVFSENYINDSSLDGRIWSFTNGLFLFKKYPLLGTGPGSYGGKLSLNYASPVYLEGIQRGYTALYFTDNQYLEILLQSGLVGFLAFLGFIAAVFYKAIMIFKDTKDIIVISSLAAFVTFMVCGLFANVLEFGAIAVPMGLILGAGISSSRHSRESVNPENK